MAPSVARARRSDGTERGIDIAFESVSAAREARARVKAALDGAGFADRVGVWLWRPSGTGVPATPAGHAAGMELRLHPKGEPDDEQAR
jgi:hypothetical protein